MEKRILRRQNGWPRLRSGIRENIKGLRTRLNTKQSDEQLAFAQTISSDCLTADPKSLKFFQRIPPKSPVHPSAAAERFFQSLLFSYFTLNPSSPASRFIPRQSRDYKVRRKRNAIEEKDIYEFKGYYGFLKGRPYSR